MKLKKSIAISESGFVFNAERGDSFSVNPIGASILQYLQQGDAIETNVMRIREQYEVDFATAEKDVYDFVHQIQQLNMTEL